ncbi:hypothetical protein [Marinomonas fungiae]|uniref:YgiT-type zinc finger domain n=1 Tax=Marinomonas fungiae TaxID=1137284 RepID=A0A0K6IIM7_9GAMM|nr:hypothetical protein [Marinomonas fungiae]CUB02931.1 hypothetical protein Ga0061065_102269 [Marinomonas fungiae]
MNKTCQICEKGSLKAIVEWIDVDYEGHTSKIKSRLAKCDFCGSEQADNSDVTENKRAMTAFRKQTKATSESMR